MYRVICYDGYIDDSRTNAGVRPRRRQILLSTTQSRISSTDFLLKVRVKFLTPLNFSILSQPNLNSRRKNETNPSLKSTTAFSVKFIN